jgi:type VI secretion system protein ImpG
MSTYSREFIRYYHEEMRYLQEAGKHFSKQYPKIAQHLHLDDPSQGDPHVERLVEAFAFLTARLHQKVDDIQPEIARRLLTILYPSLCQGMPPCAVAEFKVDSATKGTLTKGYTIEKAKPLYANSDGHLAHFRTLYPLTLWPITIEDVSIGSQDQFDLDSKHPFYLKITLKSYQASFKELAIPSLMFHLAGKSTEVFSLYESLCAREKNNAFIYTKVPQKAAKPCAQTTLSFKGLKNEDTLLSVDKSLSPSYQLLRDVFYFPEKFMFFDVENLFFHEDTQQIELYLPLNQNHSHLSSPLTKDSLKLGCTPVVNLYSQKSDPLRYSHETIDYPLNADVRSRLSTEIHHVQHVYHVDQGQRYVLTPYNQNPYDPVNFVEHELSDMFWLSTTKPVLKEDVWFYETSLQFVDRHLNPYETTSETTIYADVWCTNGPVCDTLSKGSELYIEDTQPAHIISLLQRPTSLTPPPHNGHLLWFLVSQLTHQHIPLDQSDYGLEVIKDMLFLYAQSVEVDANRMVDGIKALSFEKTVKRVSTQAWCGFRPGTHMDLTLSPLTHRGTSSLLLGHVLCAHLKNQMAFNHFFDATLYQYGKDIPWSYIKPHLPL